MTKHYVRPDVQGYLDMLAASPLPKLGEAPVADTRAVVRAMRNLTDLDPLPLSVIKNLTIPGPAGPIPARLYDTKANRGPSPVMMFYHGGGFVIGDIEVYEPFCTEAATLLDIPVVSVDYRLAPEHPFPAGPEDCEAAARWVASSPAELGLSVTGLVPCGDSAGGNLTIVTALALRDKPAAVPVIAMCPYYPVTTRGVFGNSMTDFAEGFFLTLLSMKWFDDAYGAKDGDVRAAPLSADLSGLPPTVMMTAGLDPLRDQGRAFAAKLIEAGVAVTYREAKGNIHGFLNFRKIIPSAQTDMLISLNILKSVIAEVNA